MAKLVSSKVTIELDTEEAIILQGWMQDIITRKEDLEQEKLRRELFEMLDDAIPKAPTY